MRTHRTLRLLLLLTFVLAASLAHAHAPQVSHARAQLAPPASADAAFSAAHVAKCALCQLARQPLATGAAQVSRVAPPRTLAALPAARATLWPRLAPRAAAPRAPPLHG